MKIINAMFAEGLGGIEQALLDYTDALLLAGHEVYVLLHPKAAIRDALTSRNVQVYPIANFGAWDPIAILKLRRLFKKIKPDASIAHGNRAVSLMKAAHAPKLIGVTHNYKINCEGLAAVFCPTQDLIRYAEEHGAAKDRIYVVPNMVRVLPELPKRERHTPVVIGSMGRFVAKKGFDVFIEALAILAHRGVTFNAVLAGGGEEADALKARSALKGLSDKLRFTGWVDNKQTFFNSLDIFCLPSLHEPFGIVLLEAMAQGLPVVATHSEGPAEIIRGGVEGLLVPTGDATALADGLQAVIADRTLAQKLGEAAFAAVRERYDLPVVSAKLDLALRAVCQL